MLAHFTIYPTYFSKNQICSIGCVASERSAVIKRFFRLINNFLNIFFSSDFRQLSPLFGRDPAETNASAVRSIISSEDSKRQPKDQTFLKNVTAISTIKFGSLQRKQCLPWNVGQLLYSKIDETATWTPDCRVEATS